MVTRYAPIDNTETLKRRMRKAGISQDAAARVLGCTRIHLNYVLNGRRQSRRLLVRLSRLVSGQSAA